MLSAAERRLRVLLAWGKRNIWIYLDWGQETLGNLWLHAVVQLDSGAISSTNVY